MRVLYYAPEVIGMSIVVLSLIVGFESCRKHPEAMRRCVEAGFDRGHGYVWSDAVLCETSKVLR